MSRLPLAVALVVAAVAVVLVTRQPVSDSDLFWHLANGRDIVAGTAGVDRYSWTVAGHATPLDEWLGEVLWYGSYVIGAWRGVIALRAIVVATFVVIVVATALAAAPRRPLVALLAAAPALLVSRYAWTDRPELFGLLFFAVLVALFRDDRTIWAIPPLLLVWSNVHGSYALGVALATMVLAHRAISTPRARPTSAAIAGLGILACVPTLVRERFVSTSQFWSPPRYISEWSVPDVTTMPGLMFGVALVATLAAAFVAQRRQDRDIVVLIPAAFVSMVAARHLPFFTIAAVPVLARVGHELLERRSSAGADVLPGVVHLASGLVLLLALGYGILTAPARPDLAGFPTAAVAYVPDGPGMLNQYDWGGYLIWSSPRTPVFVDGRLIPYMGAVLDDYRAIVAAHPGWEAVADRRDVRVLLVRPTDAIAVRAPDRGWRVAYADATAVVLVR